RIGIARLEQDVVEGNALIGDAVVHRKSSALRPSTMPARQDVTLDLTGNPNRQDRKVHGAGSTWAGQVLGPFLEH
ncbi:MAG: hypothetical protein ACLQVF_32505, partial [Isosphaeraceae bacterium]